VEQKAEVGAEIFFRSALGAVRTMNPRSFAALTDENPLEALALLIGAILRLTPMCETWHEDQEAPAGRCAR